MTDDGRPGDYVQSLERGLSVISVFTPRHAAMTLTEVAERAGMNRAAARRFLHTLEYLGYVRSDGRTFRLQPRVLELGHAYLSSVHPWDAARPLMESLSGSLDENVLAGVLEDADVVCVARIVRRVVTTGVYVGGRVPAALSSMGRAILAFLPEERTDAVLEQAGRGVPVGRSSARLAALTADAFRADLALVRERGWSVLTSELEPGLTSVSAPVFDADGIPVAAINVSAHGGRLSVEDVAARVAPGIVACAASVSELFARP